MVNQFGVIVQLTNPYGIKASNGYWIVGPDSSIGVPSGNMFNTVGSGPPYANGDDWYYFNGTAWINPVGEIEVECTSK